MTTAAEAREVIERAYRARTAKSAALHGEATRVFPGGVTRSVTFHAPYPVYIAEGCGCHLRDIDGNDYIDCLGNFGAMIHGHAHPAIVGAIREQIGRGTDFGAPTEAHVSLAREIMRRVPSVERVRFTTSGTEAVLYAIRAARAFTGRSKILKMEGSYHGGYDSVSVSVDPGGALAMSPRGIVASAGLPRDVGEETLVAPFNDLAAVEQILRAHSAELAAVIVEPVTVRGMIPADAEFLRAVGAVARDLGVLYILDEVVTLRLAEGGAQQLFSVTPDLTTFGKIIGGGLPVGAFGGRADVMAGFDPSHTPAVHHSGTFAGNSAVLAAGKAALSLLDAEAYARLDALGDRLRSGLRSAAHTAGIEAQVTGLGSLAAIHLTAGAIRNYRDTLRTKRDAMRWFHLALLNRGVFGRAGGSFFLSTAMQEQEIDSVVEAVSSALVEIRPIVRESLS
jgi:glutamate-1-semialdehyde 2,1-aminomutase